MDKYYKNIEELGYSFIKHDDGDITIITKEK